MYIDNLSLRIRVITYFDDGEDKLLIDNYLSLIDFNILDTYCLFTNLFKKNKIKKKLK